MSKQFFVCGLVQESNSFNPEPTTFREFANTRWEGEAVLRGEAGDTANGIVDTLRRSDAAITAGVVMRAKSGGSVDSRVIDEFMGNTLAALAQGVWDGVVVSLHGATLSDTSDDVCGDILTAIRDAVGEQTVITACCDLHGNVTERMMTAADHVCGYQTYPHLDHYEVGARAAALAVAAVNGTPLVSVRAAVPMMAPAHGYTTDTPALKALMDEGHALVANGTVADFSVFQVQPWMNVPCIASTVLVTAADEATAATVANKLVRTLFTLREVLQGDALLTVDAVVDKALNNRSGKPVVLVDSADSPNAGACGDCATVLEAILPHRDTLYAAVNVNDEAAVKQAFALGVGGVGDFTLGASIAPQLSRPVTVENATVISLHSGDFRLEGPAERGQWRHVGPCAVLEAGKLRILLTTQSRNNGDKQFYRAFGIEPTLCDLVCVKACTSFRAGYESISGEICNTATPGAAGPVLTDLPYDRLPQPFYPFSPITEASVTAAQRFR